VALRDRDKITLNRVIARLRHEEDCLDLMTDVGLLRDRLARLDTECVLLRRVVAEDLRDMARYYTRAYDYEGDLATDNAILAEADAAITPNREAKTT
jgi:hypothetical protein